MPHKSRGREDKMPIIQLLVVLIVIGVLLYLVNTLIPMDQKIKTIINAVVVLLVVLWILGLFFPSFGSFRVGRY
jgi:ABC-type glucose/galactose transport system permease subunit